jgi:hypothetical protein
VLGQNLGFLEDIGSSIDPLLLAYNALGIDAIVAATFLFSAMTLGWVHFCRCF